MKKPVVISTLLCLPLYLPLIAAADHPSDEDIGDLSLGELFKLEVITVTSRKRVENMQDVPVSVSALQHEKLDIYGSGAMDIRFLNAKIPSLSIESSFGRSFPRFYIRGLGNTDFDLNGSQPVSLVFDNVVLENPILKGFPVFDVERIEVLRGPQGTLFGRNTPAGVVKFDSKKPGDSFNAFTTVAYGSHNSVDIKGAVGGELNDQFALRFSYLHQQKDNWIDNLAPGAQRNNVLGGHQESAARAQLLYRNKADSDELTILFNYHWRDLAASPIAFRANIITPGSNQLIAGFDANKVAQDGALRAMQDVISKGGSITVENIRGAHTLTSITAYENTEVLSRADIDGGFGDLFAEDLPSGPGPILFTAESADGIPHHRQFSQELRWSSNKDHSNWHYQLGAFYFDEDLNITSVSYDSIRNGRQNGSALQNQKTTAWALFGTLDHQLSEKLNLTLGLRYSKDDKTFFAQRQQNPTPSNGSPDHITGSASPQDSHVSWDISSTYDVSQGINFYTRIADGFRAPSVQGRLLFGDEVTVADSETILSIEAGIKADVLEQRGRINASVFHYTMTDQQITAVGGDSNFNRLVNIDETVGFGFEIDSEFALSRDFLLTASISYNHTEINDHNLAVATCAICTVLDPLNVQGKALIDGNNLPHAPQWISNFTARYAIEFGDGELFVYTDWSYRSAIDFFLYQSVEFEGKSLLEGGLRVGYRWETHNQEYELALFARNITDQENIIGGIDFNNLTGIINEGRFIGVELKMNFF